MRALSSLPSSVLRKGVQEALAPDIERLCTTLSTALPRENLPRDLLNMLDAAGAYDEAGVCSGAYGDAQNAQDSWEEGVDGAGEAEEGPVGGGYGITPGAGEYELQREQQRVGDAGDAGALGVPLLSTMAEGGAQSWEDGGGGRGDVMVAMRLDQEIELVVDDEDLQLGAQEGDEDEAGGEAPFRGPQGQLHRLQLEGRISVLGQVKGRGAGSKGGFLPPSSKPLKDIGKPSMQVGWPLGVLG